MKNNLKTLLIFKTTDNKAAVTNSGRPIKHTEIMGWVQF